MGSNFRVQEPFHEYLTHKNVTNFCIVMGGVRAISIAKKNFNQRISIKTQKLGPTKISCYMVTIFSCYFYIRSQDIMLYLSYGVCKVYRYC